MQGHRRLTGRKPADRRNKKTEDKRGKKTAKRRDTKAKMRKEWRSLHKATVKLAKTKYVGTAKGKAPVARGNAKRPRWRTADGHVE